jgi:alginate O-acetyltransferase complex protein AlgI
MLLGGIWHGANWTFVIWGAWHGAILAVERALGVKGNEQRPIWAWGVTTLMVAAGWVLFRAVDVGNALDMYSGMIGLHGFGIRDLYAWQVSGLSLLGVALGVAVCAVEPWFDPKEAPNQAASIFTRRVAYLSMAASVFGVLAIGKLVAESDSPFLYFQF